MVKLIGQMEAVSRNEREKRSRGERERGEEREGYRE